MDFVITMTLWNRSVYTMQTIDALSKCDGIEKYLILPFIDPIGEDHCFNPDVCGFVEAISFAECQSTLNLTRLNTAANTHKVLSKGFQEADFVIHIEDDIVLARDALAYFEWAREKYRDDKEVFAVTGWHKAELGYRQYAVRRKPYFTCWGWATWRDRWEEIKNNWSYDDTKGWAVHLNHKARGDRVEIYPEFGRAQNIGVEKGMRVPDPEWHREHQWLEEWAGNYDIPPGEYFEAKEQECTQDG